jgi:glycosyltransferase involved in cell wall biosynthesis
VKVLILSWEYPPHMVGGLGQHVYDLSRFLALQGVMVHVITPRVQGCPDEQVENGVFIHRVGTPAKEECNFKSWTFSFNSEAIGKAVAISSQINGLDVIHAHDWLVAYAGRSVSKIFELPLVTTIHATEHGRNLGLHNRIQVEINEIEKNLALEADRVIGCSRYMQSEISTLFGLKPSEITVIPNGVDPDLFTALPEEPLPYLDTPADNVFFIGRLVPEKGIKQLINCFPRVLKHVPDARLVIGGRGPERKNLVRLTQKLKLSEKVKFLGFLRDKERNYVYNQARVAVFPSWYEPFGIVALEAMATRTPVIVGDVGGLAEIVEHNTTGLKVTPGNEEELANAIVRLLKDQDLAQKLSRNAYEKVASVYSWKAIARATIDVYREAVAHYPHRQVG